MSERFFYFLRTEPKIGPSVDKRTLIIIVLGLLHGLFNKIILRNKTLQFKPMSRFDDTNISITQT